MSDNNVLVDRTRLLGTVIGYQKLAKDKQKIVKYAPDDESDWSTMKTIVIFGNLRLYNRTPLNNIPQAYMYLEGKVGLRADDRLWVGNNLAFDAAITFDNNLQMYKLNRVGNICGRSVRWLGFLTADKTTLLPSAEFNPPQSELQCMYCSHYDRKLKRPKSTCASNMYR